MSVSHAFRSHLMQQFVANAKNQSRPPLALLGLLGEPSSPGGIRKQPPSPATSNNVIPSISTTSCLSIPPLDPMLLDQPCNSGIHTTPTRTHRNTSDDTTGTLPRPSWSIDSREEEEDDTDARSTDDWKALTDRAIACGLSANKHHAETLRFKRLSQSLELANIAYHVRLRLQNAETYSEALASALKRREKWRKVPAFLVALVRADVCQSENDTTMNHDNDCMYETLDFIPPRTQRELEEYAAACTAVQNILLSLHAEKVAAKWITDSSVIHTKAFRRLIQAEPHDRVVALIMMGEQQQQSSYLERRKNLVVDEDRLRTVVQDVC